MPANRLARPLDFILFCFYFEIPLLADWLIETERELILWVFAKASGKTDKDFSLKLLPLSCRTSDSSLVHYLSPDFISSMPASLIADLSSFSVIDLIELPHVLIWLDSLYAVFLVKPLYGPFWVGLV